LYDNRNVKGANTMNKTIRKHLHAGFTLVELLIVVIILGVLAAIVIPQFSSSTTDAKEAALDSNLSALRSAIELYRVQHTGGIYPGAVATTAGAACAAPAAKGTGAANSAQAWLDSMVMYSDAAGNTCTVGDATVYKYGPYVRGKVPSDGITGKGSVAADVVVTTTGVPIAPAAATGGWATDTKSGQVVMNSNAVDSKAAAYSTH
jgi:prepilin-type N-terminal cleavage/methylation domain-containing protein